jgi:hypothetical protein
MSTLRVGRLLTGGWGFARSQSGGVGQSDCPAQGGELFSATECTRLGGNQWNSNNVSSERVFGAIMGNDDTPTRARLEVIKEALEIKRVINMTSSDHLTPAPTNVVLKRYIYQTLALPLWVFGLIPVTQGRSWPHVSYTGNRNRSVNHTFQTMCGHCWLYNLIRQGLLFTFSSIIYFSIYNMF